jgi:GxxExxY protein
VDAVASAVLNTPVEVHRKLGPGFFESVYEQALRLERTLRRIPFVRQPAMAIVYKDHVVGDPLRPRFSLTLASWRFSPHSVRPTAGSFR